MFSVFFGRLISWWKLILGFIIAAIPVIAYVIGRREGKAIVQNDVLKDTARTEKERADFYKEMGEASNEAQSNRPANRDQLIDRLRQHGL